jgi:bacteriophage exclusion system BrxC/D-like protein
MATRPSEGELPIGGVGLGVGEYLEFLRKEYLADFIRRGGASVKLAVVGDDQVAERFHTGLASAARVEGYLFAGVDAANVRVHLVDQVFFAVARQIEWQALATSAVRFAYDAVAFPVPDAATLAPGVPGQPAPGPGGLTVATVAAAYDVNPRELYRSVRRQLEQALLGGAGLAHEFRLAMLRLCQAELGVGDVDVVERDAVLGWLQGERVPLAALRSALIYGRIGRHNARSLFVSLVRWLPTVGVAGLTIGLDLARLAVGRRPPVEEREGVYYSKAAVLDAYEVVRQIIDATDSLTSVLMAVVLPPELVTDEVRGLPAYSALQLRVADEVRDRRRTNPYAALVRLDVRLEAIR